MNQTRSEIKLVRKLNEKVMEIKLKPTKYVVCLNLNANANECRSSESLRMELLKCPGVPL